MSQGGARIETSAKITIGLSIALLVVPILVDLAGGPQRAFGYIAPDTMYYLTFARNRIEHGAFTFDQQHPSNGFHPLWQMLVTLLLLLGDALHVPREYEPMVLVLAGMVLMAFGLYWIGRALTREDGTLTPFFPLVVSGVIAPLSWPFYSPSHDYGEAKLPGSTRRIFGTLWSFINGMESSVTLFFFAAALLFFVRRPKLETKRDALVMGGLLLATTFARLDHVFFSFCVLLPLLVAAGMRRDKQALFNALLASGVMIVGLGVYLAVNQVVFSSAFPISGRMKSTFPFFTRVTYDVLKVTLANPSQYTLANVSRLFLLLAPVLIALLVPLYTLKWQKTESGRRLRLREGRTRLDLAILACVPAVLALGVYNFCFLPLVDQGYWYFPLSSLLAALFVISALSNARLSRLLEMRRSTITGTLSIVIACSIGFFFIAHHRAQPFQRYSQFFFEVAPELRSHYGKSPPKLLEFDDAIVAASTGFPTMSGLGLALDAEAARAYKADRALVEHTTRDIRADNLLDIAVARGFNCLTTVGWNKSPRIPNAPARSELVQRLSSRISPKKLEEYDLEVEYQADKTNFWIICAKPRR